MSLSEMLLEVLQFPDPRLREKACAVRREEIDQELRDLARNMGETMYDEPGIGLASIQVGVKKRLIIMVWGADHRSDHGKEGGGYRHASTQTRRM